MKKIILTRGLPASGKTTWCKQLQVTHPGQYKRVNKDDLRAMVDNGRWSKHNEAFILHLRDSIVEDSLKSGYNVIVDDTNFHPKHEAQMRLIAQLHEATVEIQDFTDVPLRTCIERDLKRPNPVGEKVIRKMYDDYLRPQVKEPEYDAQLPDTIICDLDGTLSLLNGRNPYDASTCEQDGLNRPVAAVVDQFHQSGKEVLLVSGRSEDYRGQTEAFLRKHNVPYSLLLMRPSNDTRKDASVKQEIYERDIKGKYNVLFVLDDRNQVVEMWRSLGLTVFQVAEGYF